MRLSLSSKFSLFCALTVVLVAGATSYVMVSRLGASGERELISRDRELARVLAGLRRSDGRLDFDTLQSFVGSSEKADTGLVYVLETDRSGALLQGALNGRLFAQLDPSYAQQLQQGHKHVLRELAVGNIDRGGRINEYRDKSPAGKVRLGFDVHRIRERILEERNTALTILLVGLALGVSAAVLMVKRLMRPVRRLVGAMQAVASGDVDQTVQVTSRDELALLADSFNQMTYALREKKRSREILSLYLSDQVMARILRETSPLEMVPEERAVTVISLYLDGYAEMSRRLPPRQSIMTLNDYLAPIIDALAAFEASIDQLEGPRLIAVWGAPADARDPELSAVGAALAARSAVIDEARRQAAAGGCGLQARIGICTGRAVAGNIGSARRVAYRVFGGAAELAREIERIAQPGEILASEVTYSKISGQVEARAGAPLILDGMEEAIPLYRIDSMRRSTVSRRTLS